MLPTVQDQLLSILTECLMHPVPQITLVGQCQASCLASVKRTVPCRSFFFTDRMVQHVLRGKDEHKERWEKEVGTDWSNNPVHATWTI
jgi:hypothetical protein